MHDLLVAVAFLGMMFAPCAVASFAGTNEA